MAETTTKKIDFAKIQAELEVPKMDKENPAFHSGYVSRRGLLNVVLPVLNKAGLSLSQGVKGKGGDLVMWTEITNAAGEAVKGNQVPIAVEKPGPQAMASAQTYASRKGIELLLGLAGEESDDDDGNAAERPTAVAESRPRQTPDSVITKAQAGLIHLWLEIAEVPEDYPARVKASFGIEHWNEATKKQMDALKDKLVEMGRLAFEKDPESGKETAYKPKPPEASEEEKYAKELAAKIAEDEALKYLEGGGEVPDYGGD